MRKEIFIIRHGQTDLNKEGVVQGRGINSDLNETGREQARRFFNQYKSFPFQKIYTSDLKRTWQTVGSFIDLGIPWEKLSGLDEMAWGIYEGMPAGETREGFKSLINSWAEGDYTTKIEGGESPLEVQARQKVALEYILGKKDENEILICMHGRAIRIFLCLMTDTELRYMDTFPHQNLSLYRVLWEDGKFTVLAFNNIDHIQEIA